jgi:uncharacterized protein YdaU (DUF1376 family)
MKEKPPAYQRYPKDYLTDERVMVMTLEQEGAYNRLLDYSWLHGSIPDDVTQLAPLCKTTPEHMAELWPGIAPCFVEKQPGRLVNRKLEKVRAEQKAYRKRRQEAGKKGAEARWSQEDNSTANPIATTLPMAHDSPSPSSAPSTSSVPTEPGKPDVENPLGDAVETLRETLWLADTPPARYSTVANDLSIWNAALRAGYTDDRMERICRGAAILRDRGDFPDVARGEPMSLKRLYHDPKWGGAKCFEMCEHAYYQTQETKTKGRSTLTPISVEEAI